MMAIGNGTTKVARAELHSDKGRTPLSLEVVGHIGVARQTFDFLDTVDLAGVVGGVGIAHQWAAENLGKFDADRIKVVICSGTAMSPTIPAGSLLFVDVSVRTFAGDGIYCLSIGRGQAKRLVVKRIQQRTKPPRLEVISDNPTGPSPEVYLPAEEDQLPINARVVAWWALGMER